MDPIIKSETVQQFVTADGKRHATQRAAEDHVKAVTAAEHRERVREALRAVYWTYDDLADPWEGEPDTFIDDAMYHFNMGEAKLRAIDGCLPAILEALGTP